MKPVSFHRQEQLIVKSDIAGVDYNLPVIDVTWDNGSKAILCCWRVSLLEILKLIFTRKIYVSQLRDDGNMDPISLCTDLKDIGITEKEFLKKLI